MHNLWVLFIFSSWLCCPLRFQNSPQISWWEGFLEFENFPPLLRLPPQHAYPSLTLLSLFLSFIFYHTSFWRQLAAFLGAWCPLLVFRICFVVFAQGSNDLSMNLWGRKWSPRSIPLTSKDRSPHTHFLLVFTYIGYFFSSLHFECMCIFKAEMTFSVESMPLCLVFFCFIHSATLYHLIG